MLYTIGILTLTAAVGAAYLIYKLPGRDFVKVVILPLFIAVGLLAGYHYVDQLGKPKEMKPEGEWGYVHHTVTGGGEFIELWVMEGPSEDRQSRLYKFEYNRENAKELEKAKKKTEQGQPQKGQFVKNDNPDQGEESSQERIEITHDRSPGPQKNS